MMIVVVEKCILVVEKGFGWSDYVKLCVRANSFEDAGDTRVVPVRALVSLYIHISRYMLTASFHPGAFADLAVVRRTSSFFELVEDWPISSSHRECACHHLIHILEGDPLG